MNTTALHRIVLFLATVLTLLGIVTFFIMPREENPRIKRRNAVMSLILPGTPPEKIQRLAVKPIEDELLRVEALKDIKVEIRLNVAIFQLELKDSTRNIDAAWIEVERALKKAEFKIPKALTPLTLDFSVIDVEAVVLALTGSENLIELYDAALILKDDLRAHSEVSHVKIFGSPGIEIRAEVDTERMNNYGISALQMLSKVQKNNVALSTGLLTFDGERKVLSQDNDYRNEKSISEIKFESGKLNTYQLQQFAKVKRTQTEPAQALFRWQGKSAIGLGIVPKEGLNIVSFGENISEHIQSLKAKLEPIQIEIVAFQPVRTENRISDLLISLFSGMALMALFLGLTSGFATAMIVTVCVPVITLIGLFIYYLTGGVLQQISIAAFVISIGQFIDNIIVVIDSVQKRMKLGLEPELAAQETSQELKWPMAFATLTGICAFLPMLSSQGSTADFVFSLPLVAVISLVCSYFIAIYLTPILSQYFLNQQQKVWVPLPLEKIENLFSQIALGPLWKILALVGLIAGLSIVGLIRVEKEFFPESDRNEFLFSVELRPSADITQTNEVLKDVESQLKGDPRVLSIASFGGGDSPRFYYNLPNPQKSPQIGQLLITTSKLSEVKEVGSEIETKMKAKWPGVNITSLYLQQGPPIAAKIEIHIFSESVQRRTELKNTIQNLLSNDPRIRSVRPDSLEGLKHINLISNDEKLADLNLTREELNTLFAFHSSGVAISEFRFDRNSIPIVFRDSIGQNQTTENLMNSLAVRGRNIDFKMKDLAQLEMTDHVPLLRRRKGETYSQVLADLQPTSTFARVMSDLKLDIQKVKLESGERIEFGGDAKGAGEANASIFKVVPAAMILLVLLLLLEFKSFRKVGIAILALPVTIMGVFPGLWLGQAPFGFMSLLGLLALVGIAINNIILLLEAMQTTGSLKEAIASRFRAIFLTTTLTILGLIPLALEESSLWPPLAWTLISGLLSGTVATLIVVPGLYRIFFKQQFNLPSVPKSVLTLLILIPIGSLFIPTSATAKSLSLQNILDMTAQSNEQSVNSLRKKQYELADQKSFREAYAPEVTLGAELFQRDRDLKTETPFGSFPAENKNRVQSQIQIRQPLIDFSKMGAARSASQLDLKASEKLHAYETEALKLSFAAKSIEILVLQSELKLLNQSIENTKSRRSDIIRLINKGRVSQSDLLKTDILIEKLNHQSNNLLHDLKVLTLDLQKALNLNEVPKIQSLAQIQKMPQFQLNQDTGNIENLKLNAESTQSRIQQIKYSGLPVVEAFARGIHVEGRNLTDRQWMEVGVGLKWELFAGGVRQTQRRELNLKKEILNKQTEIQRRNQQTSFEQSQNLLKENFRWIDQLKKLKQNAQTNKAVETNRYFEGRGSLNDLVEADNLSLELDRDFEVTGLKLWLNCLQLQLLTGQEVKAECE